MGNLWYFAYGSNLAEEQMRQRVSSCLNAQRARLEGYRFVFNKLGRDGTGKANIAPNPGRTVLGVAYLLSPKALEDMDRHEGVRGGDYYRLNINVLCDSGESLDAVTYVAGQKHIRSFLVPAPDYLQRILSGADEHQLPQEYIEEIKKAASGNG